MRTVVKAAFRSLSASTVTDLVFNEFQSKVDLTLQLTRRGHLSLLVLTNRSDMSQQFEMKIKSESLSPVYRLTVYEETCFDELQDKEIDYYPNNSIIGDMSVLNKDVKTNISEQTVNSTNIIVALKNIRFVNSIVFKQNAEVFITTVNYIQRLLHIKAVKKDLMQFISAAMYDLALEHKTGKALSKDQVTLLLSLVDIPVNHIEDFGRMKALLLDQLKMDLDSISIVDYLKVLLRIDVNYEFDNSPEWHSALIEIASILASSCELTHFTLACQAISLVNIAARHVSFNSSFYSQFSDMIEKFPMIFVSPVRLNQFAKLDNLTDENIKHCAESIVRYLAKYYAGGLRSSSSVMTAVDRKILVRMGCVDKGETLWPLIEEEEQPQHRHKLNIGELMEKLSKVRLALNSQINGKQKQHHKRIKKKLNRQLKKYVCCRDKEQMGYTALIIEDDDSAISSSSNLTSPANSPLSF